MYLKPLGIVTEIVESVGMNISYAHDDLVFMEHNAFLLQFTSESSELLIHINKDADNKGVNSDIARLQASASEKEMTITKGRLYKLSQADKKNIRIEFF